MSEFQLNLIVMALLCLPTAVLSWRAGFYMQRVWNCLSYRSACCGFFAGNLLVAGINGWFVWHFRDEGLFFMVSIFMWVAYFLASVWVLIAHGQQVNQEKKMARAITLAASQLSSQAQDVVFTTSNLSLSVRAYFGSASLSHDEQFLAFLQSLIFDWGKEVRPGVFAIAASKLVSTASLVDERYPGWI